MCLGGCELQRNELPISALTCTAIFKRINHVSSAGAILACLIKTDSMEVITILL